MKGNLMHSKVICEIGHILFCSKQQILFLLNGVILLQIAIFMRMNYKNNINIDAGLIAIGSASILLFLRQYFVKMGDLGETLSFFGIVALFFVLFLTVYQLIRQIIKNNKAKGELDRIIRIPRHSPKIQRKKIFFFLLRLVISSGLLIALILTY
jgi:hypothetical protein